MPSRQLVRAPDRQAEPEQHGTPAKCSMGGADSHAIQSTGSRFKASVQSSSFSLQFPAVQSSSFSLLPWKEHLFLNVHNRSDRRGVCTDLLPHRRTTSKVC